MKYQVIFSPEAEAHLLSIYDYVASEASPETARRFTDAITDYCAGLTSFPERGHKRDDLRAGLRIIGFRRRVAIAFTIGNSQVDVIGIFYGGQDYEAVLTDDL